LVNVLQSGAYANSPIFHQPCDTTAERFGVDYHERSVGKLLAALGFSHISARPRHVGQDAEVMAAFKKNSRTVWQRS